MTTRIFLDSPVAVEGMWSDGPARTLMRLGEAGAVRLFVSSRILRELEAATRRKTPSALGLLAVLLDRCSVAVVPRAATHVVEQAMTAVGDRPTAYVVADAGAARVDYFVTLDNERILHNARLAESAPFAAGTPGDCLAWLKQRMVRHE